MPIRIKPVHDFGPCTLSLESIQEITAWLDREFSSASYRATVGVWELYDEPRDILLQAIAAHHHLDAFEAKADSHRKYPAGIEAIQLIFNNQEASMESQLSPDQAPWLDHALLDIEKCILPPTWLQRVAVMYRLGRAPMGLSTFLGSVVSLSAYEFSKPSRFPYTQIILRKRAISPLFENIKANLLSNLIWAFLGAAILLLSQWFLRKYGIDINPFDGGK